MAPPAKTKHKDKTDAINWAQAMLKEKAVIFDLETTGFKNAYVVQIGVIDLSGDVLMDVLVNPGVPIPKDATGVHGITDEMVKDAESFKKLYIQLSLLLAGKTAIAYNVDFDKSILTTECQRLGLPMPKPKKWACAMKTYAAYWGQWNSRRKSYVWQSLSKACDQQDIVVKDAHQAIGDCQMTLALIQKMAATE